MHRVHAVARYPKTYSITHVLVFCGLLFSAYLGSIIFSRFVPSTKYQIHDVADYEIDIVVTWVNGSDTNWQNKYIEAQRAEFVNVSEDQFAERFISHDELRYVLRSIDQNYPWFRKLFLVTADQIPSWINVNHPQLRIVSHSEIFPESVPIPSFNSNSIEFALGNIPDLTEHFIYFNDDMFLNDRFYPSDFFTDNGTMLFATNLNKHWPDARLQLNNILAIPGVETHNLQFYFAMCFRSAALCEEFFNTTQHGEPLHYPIPLSKQILNEVAQVFEHDVNVTVHNRFRKLTDLQFETTINLYGSQTNLGMQVSRTRQYDYCYVSTQPKFDKFRKVRKREFVLNYVAHEFWDQVEQVLRQWWPQPSRFELR